MPAEFFEPTKKVLLHMNIDTTANEYLYHYTRYSGTVGILDSGCFLVSRSDALDDAAEIVHIKKVLNCVSRILKKNSTRNINESDDNGFFWGKIIYYLEFLEYNFNNDNTMKDFDIYVLSMTEIEDSEMLYDNYSTNKGYRLKFDTERLLDFTKPPYNYKQFNGYITTAGRVNYSFRKQVSIIRNDVLNIYSARKIGDTWRYVNRNGGPDKRFSNNKRLPIMLYGVIRINSSNGINLVFHCSQIDTSSNFQHAIGNTEQFLLSVNNKSQAIT